jgi:hypothetical protein
MQQEVPQTFAPTTDSIPLGHLQNCPQFPSHTHLKKNVSGCFKLAPEITRRDTKSLNNSCSIVILLAAEVYTLGNSLFQKYLGSLLEFTLHPPSGSMLYLLQTQKS